MKLIVLFLAVILTGCGPKKDARDAAYVAAIQRADDAYRGNDAQHAYDGEKQLIEFVQQYKREGRHLPNPDVLLWQYPRLALVAEHLGKKEEAAHLFEMTERYAKQLYPNAPASKTSVESFRSALEQMDPPETVLWKK